MEAKDTAMKDKVILQRLGGHWENFLVPVWRQSLLEAQAEISFRAGRKEVVDWVKSQGLNDVNSYDVYPEELEAQLKEWGIE